MLGAATKQEQFSVVSEQRGHAAHLRLSGEIDIATSPVLDGWLQAAESNGNSAIVIDLEQVTFMDVSGLRSFLRATERASRSGRTFAIVRAPAIVQKVLQITHTTHLLAAHPVALSDEEPSQMCCDGKRTAAEHRKESSDGRCCSDS